MQRNSAKQASLAAARGNNGAGPDQHAAGVDAAPHPEGVCFCHPSPVFVKHAMLLSVRGLA